MKIKKITEMVRLNEEKKEIEKRVKELKKELKDDFTQENFIVKFINKVFRFKVQKTNKLVVDEKKLKELYPDVYEKVLKVVEYEFLDCREIKKFDTVNLNINQKI